MKNRIFAAIAVSLIFAAGIAAAATLKQGVYGARAINVLTLTTNLNDAETITIGADVYEIDLNGSNRITAGRIRIDMSTNGTKATNVLVLAGNAADTETVTIGNKVYTFKTTITTADGDVLVGASAAASATNLYNAITLGTGSGTTYGSGTTLGSNCTANAVTTTSVWIQVTSPGVEGNAIGCTETGSSIAFAAATCSGGFGPYPTDPFVSTNLASVISRSNTMRLSATVIATNQILIYSLYPGNVTHTNGENIAGASFASTYMFGGTGDDPILPHTIVRRVPTANEKTLGQMHFMFPFPPSAVLVQVRGTNGLHVLWTGATVISGNRVTIDNTGASPWGVTNSVTLEASP